MLIDDWKRGEHNRSCLGIGQMRLGKLRLTVDCVVGRGGKSGRNAGPGIRAGFDRDGAVGQFIACEERRRCRRRQHGDKIGCGDKIIDRGQAGVDVREDAVSCVAGEVAREPGVDRAPVVQGRLNLQGISKAVR